MRSPIALPRLLGFRLHGFDPIFKGDVAQGLDGGPYVILGGNGLGKTTITQAVVYGLTGGTNHEAVEEEKRFRWDHGYFRERLSARGSAFVEVEFAFGKRQFSVRRGFRGSQPTAFRAGKKEKWTEDSERAATAFRHALSDYGGYQTAEDFAFTVNRLLYLPETRRLIAWDTHSQVRLLMLLNQDVADEERFRRRQEKLTELDSQKRHLHVVIGKLEQQISESAELKGPGPAEGEPRDSVAIQRSRDLPSLVDQLRVVVRERVSAQSSLASATRALSDVSSEIESLREQVEATEATLIEGFLALQERESGLALQKLSESGICPACGTPQPELQAQAQERSRNGLCMICGSDLRFEPSLDLATLRSQLSEKLRSQETIEKDYVAASARLDALGRRQEELQTEINRLRSEQPVLTLLERNVPVGPPQQLRGQMEALKNEMADLEAQIAELREDLEREYAGFRHLIDARLRRLHAAYTRFATAFLGLACTLDSLPQGQLVSLSVFVPKFAGAVRPNEHSCSEAQRFFLDIAFRMALIDLASGLSSEGATFICETPETALDMSYIDNVVKMFADFVGRGHNVLLTANVQVEGIAQKVLASALGPDRAGRVINLFDIGQLSDVHRAAMPKLKSAIRKTLGAAQ
jgi:cell division protein FtsB